MKQGFKMKKMNWANEHVPADKNSFMQQTFKSGDGFQIRQNTLNSEIQQQFLQKQESEA